MKNIVLWSHKKVCRVKLLGKRKDVLVVQPNSGSKTLAG